MNASCHYNNMPIVHLCILLNDIWLSLQGTLIDLDNSVNENKQNNLTKKYYTALSHSNNAVLNKVTLSLI